ncbi:sodium/proline symporter [Salinicoccus kekensis]|uniref:Sodium/proline symporter n=1 Tax=Salinicoccus kekensis TaxID=714307 RepID=A0A285UPQ4_9STAP|nr:sodium/proline symporter [Salinicoccus kekensis]SOC43850.1 SSS family solute:Na+ symporter/sodium/proline symporter [Salinicoccus kekensis]
MGGIGILSIVIIYMILLLALGIWSARISTQGSAEYFLGGRKLGPWVLSMSEKASESSGFMTVGLPGEAYSTGMSAAWNAVSSVFSIFNWLFFAKRIRRLSEIQNSITVPDFLSARYKDDTHIMRWVSIVVMTVFMTVYVCAQFVAFGVLFEVVLGVNFATGVIVGGIVTIIYTIMGGFFAVSLTDFIQGLLMAFAFLVLPILAITELGGFNELGYQLTDMMGQEFLAPFFGSSALTLAGLIAIISYLFIGIGFNGSPHVLVRYMALRHTRDVKRIAMIGIVWMMVAYYGAVLIGLSGLALFPNLADPEHIFPTMAVELFPWWIAGIIIAGALSAMMSSIDSMLLIASSTIAEDLWNKILKKGELREDKTILISRIATAALGGLAIIIALNPLDSVFWLAVFAWAGLATCFGPPIILSLFWKRVTKAGAIAGMIVGPVVTVIWYFWPPVDIYEGGPAFIAAMITIVLVSLMTKPPEGDDFERLWDKYTEKNELGRFSFLPSDEEVIRNLKASNLDNKTEKEIIMELIDRDFKSASTFQTNG